MKRLLAVTAALVGVVATTGCDPLAYRPTRVSQITPYIWHIETENGRPETWLMHTCPNVGEAILRFRATPGDEGYGIDVWCVKVSR